MTVSSVYTGPISSGQVSVLNSSSSGVVTQTIPVGSSTISQISVSDTAPPVPPMGAG